MEKNEIIRLVIVLVVGAFVTAGIDFLIGVNIPSIPVMMLHKVMYMAYGAALIIFPARLHQ